MPLDKQEGNFENTPNHEANKDDRDNNQTGKDSPSRPRGGPKWRGVVDAVKLSRGDVSGELSTEVVTGGIFAKFRSPTFKIAGMIPGPAVSDGMRTANS